MKKLIFIKNLIFLQIVIIIYSLASIAAKKASMVDSVLSPGFFLYYGAEFLVLVVYAVLWQQVIKKFELSVAYANRAMAILWSMVWAVLLFHNEISIPNLFGVILIVIGTIIMNRGQVRSNAENEEEELRRKIREKERENRDKKSEHTEDELPIKEEDNVSREEKIRHDEEESRK